MSNKPTLNADPLSLEEMSERFFEACNRIHNETNNLYENLHPSGAPLTDQEEMGVVMYEFKQYIRLELDLVKTLIDEYHESRK
jgi:hypothetical protein